MALTDAFYKAVESGDVRMVRIMMKDSLLIDTTFTQLKEMEQASKNMTGLYDEHDGREFCMDKSAWNDAYMNQLKVQVVSNFSRERMEHLKEVVRYLRPVKLDGPSQKKEQTKRPSMSEQPRRSESYQEQKARDKKEGNYRGVKIAAGAAVGAVVGGTVGAAVGGTVTVVPVVVGAAAGAVVGGVIVAAATNS